MAYKTLGIQEDQSLFVKERQAAYATSLQNGVFNYATQFPYSTYLPFNNGVNDATYFGTLYFIQHAGCVVGNKFYVFGGYNGNANKNDLWEINLDTYNMDIITGITGGPPSIRNRAQMEAIGNKLYMWGGYSLVGPAYLQDTWEYDIVNKTWTQLAADNFPYLVGQAGAVSDGTYIYSVCGWGNGAYSKEIYKFDPTAGDGLKWSLLTAGGTTFTPRSLVGTTIKNGKIYVCGGYKPTPWADSDGYDKAVRSLYEYDIAGNTWTRLADMCQQTTSSWIVYWGSYTQYRFNHALEVAGNYLFAYGGTDYSGTATLSSGLMYDIANNAWYPTPGLLTTRAVFASCSYKNQIYLWNGSSTSGSPYYYGNSLECIPRPHLSRYQNINI